MSFLGVPNISQNEPYLRTSNTQSYQPGDFIKRFNTQKQNSSIYLSPNGTPPHFDKSLVAGINDLHSHNDDFYKSQVMERTIGGQAVLLNTMNHYQPLSGDNPQVMDQIRQEHVKIMDQKLKEAISQNGGNALQQVKTIIVEPIAQVIQIQQSNITKGYQGIARNSFVVNPIPSNRTSRIISGHTTPRGTCQTIKSSQHNKSHIQYVPYERKITELQTIQRIQRIPRQKMIIEYEQRKVAQQVPVQKTIIDYYAVQHLTQYKPQIVQQKMIQMVPIQKTYQTTSYIPVQQQIIHYPTEHGRLSHSRLINRTSKIEDISTFQGISRISHKPLIIQGNSRITSQNSFINSNSRIQHSPSRTPRKTNRILGQRNISPLTINSRKVYQQSKLDKSNISNNYQRDSISKSPSSILPFTQQLKQFQKSSKIPLANNINLNNITNTIIPSQIKSPNHFNNSQHKVQFPFNK